MSGKIPFISSATELPSHADILSGASNFQNIYAASLAINADWVKKAYQRGLFPWYSAGEPVLWHSPNPRMVLAVEQFKCSPSLKKTLKQWARSPKNNIRVTINQSFEQVIAACAHTLRHGQAGTWITTELMQAYIDLHHQRNAISVEVWQDDELVAGLYGVLIGRMFFGESMFTQITDGSKVALACWVEYLQQEYCQLIDCQQETAHLSSLGAAPIEREAFFNQSSMLMQQPPLDWDKMCAQDNLLKLYKAH